MARLLVLVGYLHFDSAPLWRALRRLPSPVRAYGNVLAATAFLYGLAVEDLATAELDARDPEFEVTVAVRAVRSAHPPPSR